MSEIPTPPGVVPPQKDEPIPFFRTVDFKARPKWELSVSFVTELEHVLQGAKEDDNKDEFLAKEMEKIYGKKEAMEIFEKTGKHMSESLARSSYRDTTKLREFSERVRVARGILGTPNWKDPSKMPPPIQFSIK